MIFLTSEPTLLTIEHIELVGIIMIPIMSGIGYLIWQQAQMNLKVETMWSYFTNHQGMHDLSAMLEKRRNGSKDQS